MHTSSPFSPRTGTPFVVEHIHRHAQTPALDLAAPDRQQRIAQDEAGNDVCPAGDRGQQEILLDFPIDPVEAFRRRGLPVENMRAGREIVGPARVRPSLAAASMYFAEVPKWVMRSGLGVVEEDVPLQAKGIRRRAAAWRRRPGQTPASSTSSSRRWCSRTGGRQAVRRCATAVP